MRLKIYCQFKNNMGSVFDGWRGGPGIFLMSGIPIAVFFGQSPAGKFPGRSLAKGSPSPVSGYESRQGAGSAGTEMGQGVSGG